jgi:hypothetical protein
MISHSNLLTKASLTSGENQVEEADQIVLLCLKAQGNITLPYPQTLAGMAGGIRFNHRLKEKANWAARFEPV